MVQIILFTRKKTKLKEFQFKFIHRILATKKELFRYGFSTDDECYYCGEKDSIDHTFIHCSFSKVLAQKVILWFNTTYNSSISPSTEELLFGILKNADENNAHIIRKFNYTSLFLHYYIFSNKINNKPITIYDFVDKVQNRYVIEDIAEPR